MRLLLVEDDPVTSGSIKLMLQENGLRVDTTDLGEVAVSRSERRTYDLIILDLVVTDMDGYGVLSRMRAAGVKTPVLILSGLNAVQEKVKGLGLGADDFMTKPFAPRELMARVQAVIRRSSPHPERMIRIDPLLVDLDRREVTIDDRPVRLTPKEYAVIETLSRQKGKLVSRKSLLRQLYWSSQEPSPQIINVFISRIRRKNGAIGSRRSLCGNRQPRLFSAAGCQAATVLRAPTRSPLLRVGHASRR